LIAGKRTSHSPQNAISRTGSTPWRFPAHPESAWPSED